MSVPVEKQNVRRRTALIQAALGAFVPWRDLYSFLTLELGADPYSVNRWLLEYDSTVEDEPRYGHSLFAQATRSATLDPEDASEFLDAIIALGMSVALNRDGKITRDEIGRLASAISLTPSATLQDPDTMGVLERLKSRAQQVADSLSGALAILSK